MAQERVCLGAVASAASVRVRATQKRFGIGVSALVMSIVAAQSASAHSITEALAQFYQNNPTLKAVQLNISATNETVNQASGAALPQVSLGVSSTPSRSFSYTGAGGTIANSATNADYLDSASLGLSLSVTQAVDLSGSIGAQIESAYLGLENNWNVYYQQEQGFLLEAVNAYMTVISSRADVALRNGAVSLLAAQRNAAQARFDAGVGTSTDVANINASLQGARAQMTQASGNRAIAESNFRRVFGIDPHNLEFPNSVPNLPRSLNEAIDRAMVSDPNLIQADANIRVAELDLVAQKAALGPSMQLSASASHSYDLMRDSNDNSTSFSAGGSISMPLYQGGAGDSRVRQAVIVRDAAKASAAAQREQTRANVVQAWQNLQTAEATLNSIVSQVNAAELALRGARAEEEVGEKTFLDTLDAENALTSAQVSLSTTRAQVVVAGYALLQSMGDLTAEKLNLPVGTYFRPSNDLDKRQIDNFATAIYLGTDRATATPSFVRWMYNYAAGAAGYMSR